MRLNDSVGRCVHVRGADEVVTLLIEGLNPVIRSLVQAYRDEQRNTTYLEINQQARYQEEAVRSQNNPMGTPRGKL